MQSRVRTALVLHGAAACTVAAADLQFPTETHTGDILHGQKKGTISVGVWT